MKQLYLAAALLAAGICVSGTTACTSGSGSSSSRIDASSPLASLLAMQAAGETRLTPEYIRQTIDARDAHPAIAAAHEAALVTPSRETRAALMRAIELHFVHDPATSTLDLIPDGAGRQYRDFAWEFGDYPGGPEGPNEAYAREMVAALSEVRPERRANSGHDPVVVRAQATEEVWQYMENEWKPIPGEEEYMLNRHAVDAYVAMREAAKAEGVELVVLSAHRTRARAEANAARANNPTAVASFSSHSLGLAIDFKMSHGDFESREISTRPMADVVRMRESPVHKWVFLRADEFGWFPYQHEPWHWEYNPEGFRETFWANFDGEIPPMPTPE